MHSQNLLGDVFGDLQQPSHQTLERSMQMIQAAGHGAVVYLRHEGMGKGLLKRLQTPAPVGDQPRGGTDAPAFGQTTEAAPTRSSMDYGIGSQILRDLGIRRLQLITDHPFTPNALTGFGLSIESFVGLSAS